MNLVFSLLDSLNVCMYTRSYISRYAQKQVNNLIVIRLL